MTSTHYLTHAAKRLHEAASFANGMTGSNAGTWDTLAREIDAHVARTKKPQPQGKPDPRPVASLTAKAAFPNKA